MKKIFLMLVLIFLVSCSSDVVTLEPEEAYERLQNEEIVLLDVRTEAEHIVGTIPGSVLYPVDTIDESILDIYETDETIFVFCRSGNRSNTAANKLIELGYKNVYDIGGINSWPYDVY
jgi:rhodanese-related sulfurtransferase